MSEKLKSPWLIVMMLCLISATGRFVIDCYLPSLPAIAINFHLASHSAELTLTLYLLGFGSSQLIYGPLSDRYGRRKTLLVGMVIFLLGSVGCVFATSSAMLFIARFISGLGAGACGVLNRAIARDCFSGVDFSKVWSYTTTTLVITLMLAPLVGGYVQAFFSWRANFVLMAIFVGLVFAVVFCALPETNKRTLKESQLLNEPFSANAVLLRYKQIFRAKNFILPTSLYTLAFAGLMAYFQVSSIILMEHYQLSSTAYGYASLGIAFSYLLGGQLVRKYVAQIGVKLMLYLGITVFSIGAILMLLTSYFLSESWVAVIASAAVYVLGVRLVIPNAVTLAMSSVPGASGSISALIGSIQILGAMCVSTLLAQFDATSTMPLAWLLVAISALSIVISSTAIVPTSYRSFCDKFRIFKWNRYNHWSYFSAFKHLKIFHENTVTRPDSQGIKDPKG